MKNFDIMAMTIDELAALPPAILAELQDEVDHDLGVAKAQRTILDTALDRKYAAQAADARARAGKDTGTVRLTDDGLPIVCEMKKTVAWDQANLANLQKEISNGGQDPDVYIVAKTELTVRETAYATWPESVKAAFEPARTVKPGKPSYRIERSAEREAA